MRSSGPAGATYGEYGSIESVWCPLCCWCQGWSRRSASRMCHFLAFLKLQALAASSMPLSACFCSTKAGIKSFLLVCWLLDLAPGRVLSAAAKLAIGAMAGRKLLAKCAQKHSPSARAKIFAPLLAPRAPLCATRIRAQGRRWCASRSRRC